MTENIKELKIDFDNDTLVLENITKFSIWEKLLDIETKENNYLINIRRLNFLEFINK